MKKLILVLAALLLVALPTLAACGDDDDEGTPTPTPTAIAEEGALPILEVGDKWVLRGVIEGTEYAMTLEVTGEDVVDGKESYVTETSIAPPLYGIVSSMTMKLDKSTMLATRLQFSGEYEDMPYIVESTYSYELLGQPLYPRQIGKEYKVIETETTTSTMLGETETETVTNTDTYRVEKIEQITVPAGTFRCFKIVKYDEAGTALTTSWESDKAKQISVKEIDHETGEVSELVSYSLSPGP